MHQVFVRGSAPLERWHLIPCRPVHCNHTIVTKHPVGGHLHRNKHNTLDLGQQPLNVLQKTHNTQIKMITFMSVPPCGLCLKAPNGYVPLAGFRSDRAEIAFSPFSGGSQPSHFDNGSSLKLLYLKRDAWIP